MFENRSRKTATESEVEICGKAFESDSWQKACAEVTQWVQFTDPYVSVFSGLLSVAGFLQSRSNSFDAMVAEVVNRIGEVVQEKLQEFKFSECQERIRTVVNLLDTYPETGFGKLSREKILSLRDSDEWRLREAFTNTNELLTQFEGFAVSGFPSFCVTASIHANILKEMSRLDRDISQSYENLVARLDAAQQASRQYWREYYSKFIWSLSEKWGLHLQDDWGPQNLSISGFIAVSVTNINRMFITLNEPEITAEELGVDKTFKMNRNPHVRGIRPGNWKPIPFFEEKRKVGNRYESDNDCRHRFLVRAMKKRESIKEKMERAVENEIMNVSETVLERIRSMDV